MQEIEKFEICSKYRREDFDFDEIQNDRNNPPDNRGYPTYPLLMPSHQGSSFTYKISNDWFFKRKLQDGGHPHTILSQHHFSQAYNELYGTFDDLGEVIAYILAKSVIDSKTGEPIVKVPEYKLATYKDKEGVLLRGCISKNVCDSPNKTLVSMSDIMKFAGVSGNSIDVYMSAIEKYTRGRNCECDIDLVRQTLIKYSYFNWKISNSDNHKNNVMFIVEKLPNGKVKFDVSPLIDNGSAYELSVRYKNDDDEIRLESLYSDSDFSSKDENGNTVLNFSYYPYMHTAFHLENNKLLIPDTKIGDRAYNYEYSLASEMLSDKELFRQIYEIDKQLDVQTAISEIDEIYGASIKGAPKEVNWPPYLKEFMFETNNVKSKILSFVVSDYYLNVAFNATIGTADKNNPSQIYQTFKNEMMQVPLLNSKEAYDEVFMAIAQKYGIEVDKAKLENLVFKSSGEPESAKQPND